MTNFFNGATAIFSKKVDPERLLDWHYHGGRLFYEVNRDKNAVPEYYFTKRSHTNFYHPEGVVVLSTDWILDSLDAQALLPCRYYAVTGVPPRPSTWNPFVLLKKFIINIFGLASVPKSRKRKVELEKTDESRKKRLCLAVNEVEAALFRLKQVRRSLSTSIPDSTQEVIEDDSEQESSCSERSNLCSDEDWDDEMLKDILSEDDGAHCRQTCGNGVCFDCKVVYDSCDNSSWRSDGWNGSPSPSIIYGEEYLTDLNDDEWNKGKNIRYIGTPEPQINDEKGEIPLLRVEDSQPPSSPSYFPPSTRTDNFSAYSPSFNFSSAPTLQLSSSSYLHGRSESPRNINPYALDNYPSLSPSTPIKQETPPSEPLSSVETLTSNDFESSVILYPRKQVDSFVMSHSPSRRPPKGHSQNAEQNMKFRRLLRQYTIAEFQSEAPQDIYLPILTPTDIKLDTDGSTNVDTPTEMSDTGGGGKVWDAKVVEWGNDKTVRLIRVEND